MTSKRLLIIGLPALCIASLGLWLLLSPKEAAESSLACTGATEKAKQIEPLAQGDLAAFIPHIDQSRQIVDVSFVDGEGAAKTLSQFEGQTVLLNLWATWCVPCRVEMPEFDELQAEFGGDRFTVLPLSLDAGDDGKPKAFYQEIGLKHLPFFHDPTLRSMAALKGQGLSAGLPTTILIDEKGCTIGHITGPAKWAGPVAKKLIETVLEK